MEKRAVTKSRKFLLTLFALSLIVSLMLAIGYGCGNSSNYSIRVGSDFHIEFGEQFSVPEADVVDDNNRMQLVNVNCSVTDPNGQPVTLSYNQFVANKLGEYVFTFTVDNSKFDLEPYQLKIECKDTKGPTFNIVSSENMTVVGDYCEIAAYRVTDLSGINAEKTVESVYLGTEKIEVDDGRFYVEKPGMYNVSFYAEDTLGNTSDYSYNIKASDRYLDSELSGTKELGDFHSTEYLKNVENGLVRIWKDNLPEATIVNEFNGAEGVLKLDNKDISKDALSSAVVRTANKVKASDLGAVKVRAFVEIKDEVKASKAINGRLVLFGVNSTLDTEHMAFEYLTANTWLDLVIPASKFKIYTDNAGNFAGFQVGVIVENVDAVYIDSIVGVDAGSYTVQHYLELDNGEFELASEDQYVGGVGMTVNAIPKASSSHVLASDYVDTVSSGVVTADGQLVLKLFYYLSGREMAEYTVEYYFEQEQGNYVIDHSWTETLSYRIGGKATAPVKPSDTHGWNGAHSDTVSTGVVTADGSLVLKLYYYNPKYQVDYKVEYYFENDQGEFVLNEEWSTTYKGSVGQVVTGVLKSSDTHGNCDWHPDYLISGVVSSEEMLVLKIYYYKVSLYENYTVEYYFENEQGEFVKDDDWTETGFGKIGTYVEGVAKSSNTHAWDYFHSQAVNGGNILADDALVLKMYYCYPEATEYKVEHWYERQNGQYELWLTESLTGTPGSKAIAALIPSAYGWDSDHPDTKAEGGLSRDGSELVLKVFYCIPENNAEYITEYYFQTGEDEFTKKDDWTMVNCGIVGSTATAVVKPSDTQANYGEHPDYVFSGEINAEGTLVLKVYYCFVSATYRVEHYYQHQDGSYYLKTTQMGVGLVGENVNASLIPSNYAFDGSNPDTVMSGMISVDDELTLKVYYSIPDGFAEYKVEYYLKSKGSTDDDYELNDSWTVYDCNAIGTTVAPAVIPSCMYGSPLTSSGEITADGKLVVRAFYTAAFEEQELQILGIDGASHGKTLYIKTNKNFTTLGGQLWNAVSCDRQNIQFNGATLPANAGLEIIYGHLADEFYINFSSSVDFTVKSGDEITLSDGFLIVINNVAYKLSDAVTFVFDAGIWSIKTLV